ncbi:MAG: M23 family metallopeptidase [Patescibacteria group bacterium]|nr:M23 family metallopeptidase [Patescibacteria group bacterium]
MKRSWRDNVSAWGLWEYAVVLAVLAAIGLTGGVTLKYLPTPLLVIEPKTILQGDPVMFIVATSTENIIDGKVTARSSKNSATLHFFPFHNGTAALYAIDLNQATGTAIVQIDFKNGLTISKNFNITARLKPHENLAIPAQLGGNSIANQHRVVSVLASDNYQLSLAKSNTKQILASSTFNFPIPRDSKGQVHITDSYGYVRESGAAEITHRGIDFHAATGTPVLSIHDGIVRQATYYEVYGNTVVVDHGSGILSMYMHLNDIGVHVGQEVRQGQLLGHSGETGYSEGPHLHLSIRVDGISIDPAVFFKLFNVK